MSDITLFDATRTLKKFRHNNNDQVVDFDGRMEMSGTCLMQLLLYSGFSESEYVERTNVDGWFRYPLAKNSPIFVRRDFPSLDHKYELMQRGHEISCRTDTKQYWSFLNEEFKFCDVSSHYAVNDLSSYFTVKGALYDKLIAHLGVSAFMNKKVLEIGPGYGYLNKVMLENGIPMKYHCADLVKRFDHDNFIEVSGYSLENITDKFDVIIMQDVYQHLNSDIFMQYALNIKNLLKDGGRFIVSIEGACPDDHLGFFFGQVMSHMGTETMLHYMEGLGYESSLIQYRLFESYTNQQSVYSFKLKEM